MPEAVFFDHYEVLTREDGSLFELHSGARGTTYKAFDSRLRRPVALKVIKSARLPDERAQKRFMNAVRMVSRVQDRHLAAVYDLGKNGADCYYTMEFVDGPSLRTVLEQRGPLPAPFALEIAMQTASALLAGWQHGIVHGELKPSNLILIGGGAQAELKVLDMSLGHSLFVEIGALAGTGMLGRAIATHEYSSPEERQLRAPDTRSDIYSLGLILWQMLTGEAPLGSPAKEASRPMDDPLPWEKLGSLPEPVVTLLKRMLELNPDRRPQDPGELRRKIALCRESLQRTSVALGASSTREDRREDVAIVHEAPAPAARPSPVPAPAPPPAPASPATPSVFDEDVQFTVYRPQSMAPAVWSTWLAFAHRGARALDEPDYAEEVEAQARTLLAARFDEYKPARQESSAALPRESTITIVPSVDGLEFNPVQRTFQWQEPVHREEFRARPLPGVAGIQRGRITFFLGALVVAEINVKVDVTAGAAVAAQSAAQPMTTDRAQTYRQIFASYSRRDTAIVEHFEKMIAAFGDRYLRDTHTLRAGEEWGPGLEEMIRKADVFQLFWSSNSMRSPYVRQEWEYALSLGRPNFVRPTFWEEPFPQDEPAHLPPQTLTRLHFQRLPADLSGKAGAGEQQSFPTWSAANAPPMESRAPSGSRKIPFRGLSLLALVMVIGVGVVGLLPQRTQLPTKGSPADAPHHVGGPIAAAPPPPTHFPSATPPPRATPGRGANVSLEDGGIDFARRGREAQDLLTLLSDYGSARADTSPHPEILILPQVRYLMPLRDAEEVLGANRRADRDQPRTPLAGFPLGLQSLGYDGEWRLGDRIFHRLYIIVDMGDQVVGLELVQNDESWSRAVPPWRKLERAWSVLDYATGEVEREQPLQIETLVLDERETADRIIIHTTSPIAKHTSMLYLPQPLINLALYSLRKNLDHKSLEEKAPAAR